VVRRPPAHPPLDPQHVPRRGQWTPDPRRRLWNRNDADPPGAVRRCSGRRHGPRSRRLLPRPGIAAGHPVRRRQPSFCEGHIRPGHRPRRRRAHRRRPRRFARDETRHQAGRAAAADRARVQVLVGPPGRHQSSQASVRCSRPARSPAGRGLRRAEADLHELDLVSCHCGDPDCAPRPTGAAEARV
jgi:hypothetical protein